MDTDANLELNFGVGRELLHSLQYLDGTSNGALRVILFGMRITEIDIDAVAPILRDEAIVPKHNRLACALVRTNYKPQVFRVKPLGQRRGGNQVAE